jgi:hypothetical protein
MEHRHINARNDQWEVAVIHSKRERGSDREIKRLMREIKWNPKAADPVRRAIPHSQVYGWPRFFKQLLERMDG